LSISESERLYEENGEGQRIRLEYDEANAHLDHKDRYGRTLAYVFLDGGTLLNAEIIRQGYGHVYTKFPFSRIKKWLELTTSLTL
jgi:micrococcal nuclease